MHSVIVFLLGLAAGLAAGWVLKAKIGAQVSTIESDVKKL